MSKSPIEIIKQKVDTGIHYYFVSTNRFGAHEFFIGIDPARMRVFFFNVHNLKEPIGIINFTGTNDLVSILGIAKGVSNVVALKALRAILDNNFPNTLTID